MVLTFAPVVAGTAAVARHEEVLRVVEPSVQAVLNTVDHARLQVNQQRPWYVVLVVSLVEEDIFSVVSLRRVLLEDAFAADAVLLAKLLPKLVADCHHKVNSSCQHRDYETRQNRALSAYFDCRTGRLAE